MDCPPPPPKKNGRCREVAVVERLKEEWIHGLPPSPPPKKNGRCKEVAVSRGPTEVSFLTLRAYFFFSTLQNYYYMTYSMVLHTAPVALKCAISSHVVWFEHNGRKLEDRWNVFVLTSGLCCLGTSKQQNKRLEIHLLSLVLNKTASSCR